MGVLWDKRIEKTNALYINFPDKTGPNTSISLRRIAERIVIVQKNTTERIIELTIQNAERYVYNKGCQMKEGVVKQIYLLLRLIEIIYVTKKNI